MHNLLIIIIASFSISFCAWAAILFLYVKKEVLSKITLFLVSLSTGALMGGAFLHLLPEASEKIEASKLYLIVLFAFVFFFFMEKVLSWRHCHKENCPVHTFGYMNLFGDALHNFIDGLVIASTFLIDFQLGMATTLAIALHEIPQEIGDFGVLVHAGFTKKKALIINYIVALTVVLGGIVGYFISFYLHSIIAYLLPFAAGGFIYIAASDLIPEIRKETNLKRSIKSFIIFLLGIALMFVVKLIN
ncbi:ZIP family metal transporter [Candidatus Parcubacteria bacterium]|jgi:zinc and cadmium transporter|nr:ZIP family metal transporter [Candidatus Parcubacteria bacterium]